MREPGVRRLRSLERYLTWARAAFWIGVVVVTVVLLVGAVLRR